MKAYFGNESLKDSVLECVHNYGDVSTDPDKYESEYGIPAHLAYFKKLLAVGMSPKDAKELPRWFFSAIPVGVNLSGVFANRQPETRTHAEIHQSGVEEMGKVPQAQKKMLHEYCLRQAQHVFKKMSEAPVAK